MTLADMLAQPYPAPQQMAKSPLVEEAIPEVKLEWEGRNLTRREIYCLLTHLLLTNQLAALPEAWHDPLGLAMIEIADRSEIPWALQFFSRAIARIMGPRTLHELQERVRTGRADGTMVHHLLEPMLARDWRAALPFFAEVLAAPRGTLNYFKQAVEDRLEQVRVKQNIAADIWPLLMIPESHLAEALIAKTRKTWAAKLEEFMRRGMRISARDFGLIANHTAHTENLRGLVLMIESGDATRFDRTPLELESGDSVSIAHPLVLEPEERKKWIARMAQEGLMPPFDQWKGAGTTPRLDVHGLNANPADLMLHLEARGWRRGRPNNAGVIGSHSKMFPDLAVRAVVEYTGIPTTYGGLFRVQTVTGCAFENESTGQRLEAERVSPIVVSAVMQDLVGLKQ